MRLLKTRLETLKETIDRLLYEIYEGVEKVNQLYYKFAQVPIKRHRKKVQAQRLRRKLPDMLMSGYSIKCAEDDDYCDMRTCEHKANMNDVVEGCIKCGRFKVVNEDPIEF